MKRYLFSFCFLMLMATTGFSQMILVDHSRWLIELNLNQNFKNNKLIKSKTDTSLTYLLRDSTLKPMDIYCSFDKKRNCIFQKISFTCDTCYHKFLNGVLEYKKVEWQLISPNHYLSKYSKHLLLIGDDKKLYFTITLLNYSKDEYRKMAERK